MGFLEELDQKYTQETPKEEPTKPSGFLGELESQYKDAPVEQPKSFLGELEQKYDVDPDSLRNRQSRGEPLSIEQERVVFDANRARNVGEQASAIGKGVFTSLSEMVPQAFEGTKKILGASKDLTQQIGIKYLDLNPLVPEIAVNYVAGNTAEDRQANLEKSAKKEADIARSLASGAVQAGEEVINEAARGAFFGTLLTDLIQEYPAGKFAYETMKSGGPVALASEALGGKIFGEPLVDVKPITKDESFQRSMNRQSMRQQEQQEYKDQPERTTAALVKIAESSAGSLLGKSLGVPSDEQFQKDLVQELKNNAIVPDEDVALVGNMLSPLDPTFVLAGPLARASSKAFDLASGAGLRAITKPTIAGVNPIEGLGKVIRFGGEGTQKAARKFSDFLTGSEDSFIGKLADPVVAVTRRPGMMVEGAGRALRDIGRQIDDAGLRSRTGIIERAGQDARSGDFMRTVFGPGTEKAQAKALKATEKLAEEGADASAAAPALSSKRRAAARTADWVFRQAEAVARYGTSGAAIGIALGLPDLENAEQLGQMAATGAMVGTIGAARLGEKGAKLIDPRVSLKGKIDAILSDDPVSRRADEDADIERFRNTAAPDLISKADEFGNVNSVLQSFDGHLENLAIQRDQAIARGEDDVAAGMELEIKKTAASRDAVSKMTPDAMKEYQRRVDLTLADALDQAKTTGEAVGLNNIEIKLLSPVEMLGHLRDKWGVTLTNAEYVLQSLAGNNDLSDADQQRFNQAAETVNQFNAMYQTAMGQRGYAMSDNTYSDSPMHLRPANLKTPSVVINSELIKSQLGNNLHATLTHEAIGHAMRNFKEVKAMMGPLEEYLFGRKVQNADGTITEVSKGIYDNAAIDRMGDYYADLLGGDKWKAGFATEDQFRSYIKEEILAEAAGLSSNTANLRADLDSPGQAFVDWAATSNKNTFIGKIRDALGLKGVLLDDEGKISDILGETISPEVLALTRQFQRQLRDYNGSLSQVTSAAGPEVTISAVELLSSKILQNKYRGLDIWQKEQVLTIKDDEGNVVNEIVVPKSASLDPLVGQYRLEDGMLVDENGNKMQIAPEIAAANLPNNTSLSVDQRIARNPDGSPKILSNREIQARARKRGEALKNAIESAMEDGSTNRVRPVGENEYAGILSPTQLQAILALPNDIVAPDLKRKIAAFNETALRKDGTRMIVEYQAAMKGGKYKALAPKIRDVVPFGFRITEDGNFLATTISVSRIFDKINDWAKPNRNRLNLWNGDTNALWEDILHVLKNHQKGERGEVGLDVDPDMARLKKNRINDIFNLFDKATESKNPDRSVSKTRKGQDSIDRVIMGMRMDRVNDFAISNAQKLPVDYGKIKENYMPNVPVDVVQNNVAEEGGLGYKESPTIKYREPKYETTNPPRLGYIDPRTTEEGQRVLREDPTLARAFAALEGASEAGRDQRPTSGSSVIPAETEALREFAKNSGTMESPEAVQKFTDDWNAENRTAGTEHQVLLGNGDRVEKRFTATYNDTWKNYLNRILLHNILFKDSAIRLEGFQEVPEITQDRNGQEWGPGFYAKISQPYARGKHVDLIKDLKPYMESLGFVSNGPMNYYHPEYGVHVSDMHPGNAYVETDAQGNKHVNVFDPNLHLTGEKEGDAKERARVEAKLVTQKPIEDVGFSWPKEIDDSIERMRSVLDDPANMPTQVKPEAPLPVNLYEAGTSLESFGLNSLKEIAEHYGFTLPEKAKRGEIIDLVENQKSDIRFKPSAKLDETYAKAIESGDMEEAQRLVDERAREAFPNTLAIIPPTSSKQDISKQPLKIVYHGTGSDFTEFKSGLPTADDWGLFGNIPTERHAIFFAEEKDFANEYAKARDSERIIPAYLNAENPLVFDDAFDKYDELMEIKDLSDEQKKDRQTYKYIWNLRDKWEAFDGESGKEFVDWMRKKGYDSAILSETGHGIEGEPTQDVWAVLDPSQIKSADPATYDNEGKLIPLSQRFDTSKLDIRFMPAKKNSVEGESAEAAPSQGSKFIDDKPLRALDAEGNKKATQVNADSMPYPTNPNEDSVTLPPRWGMVNKNIVGMPRNFKQVSDIITRAVDRLKYVAAEKPDFAKESARFYRDMAESATKMSDAMDPKAEGLNKWLLDELNLRFLALGSPRTAVAANATKSSGSAAGAASGFEPGYKIGFGDQAKGARDTYKAWEQGGHFDLNLSGVQDKVRSFYLNGLAELIEMAQESGDKEAVDELTLRAGKSLRSVDENATSITPEQEADVQRLLDGKATIDMWDMAAKGFAWPGYLLNKAKRNSFKQPFQWTQDKFAKTSTLGDKAGQQALKELGYTNWDELRYQEARALRIDGNSDWNEKTWEERKQQPFDAKTPFTYFTEGTEAGLTPGGGGPLYDAQQGINGLLADRLNELGMADMFGKTKLKARNAQEILWALEKLDNPVKSNNDLSLFKATFDPFIEEVQKLRRGLPLDKKSRGANVLAAMDRAYNQMARQIMPLEVVTAGTSPQAKRVQGAIAAQEEAGDDNAVQTITYHVASGLHDKINEFATKHGIDVSVDSVNVGKGGYTEGDQVNVAPNMRLILRGSPEDTRMMLEALSRSLDQDGGNIMRKPTVRELNDVNVKKNFILTLETNHLDKADRDKMFLDLATLKDSEGNSFLTGFTETDNGVAIGDQFYGGNMEDALTLNSGAFADIMSNYKVNDYELGLGIVDMFFRGQSETKASTGAFQTDLDQYIADKLASAPRKGVQFPQETDAAALWSQRADDLFAKISDMSSKTKQDAAKIKLKSDLEAAVLRGVIDESTSDQLKVKYGFKDAKNEEE